MPPAAGACWRRSRCPAGTPRGTAPASPSRTCPLASTHTPAGRPPHTIAYRLLGGGGRGMPVLCAPFPGFPGRAALGYSSVNPPLLARPPSSPPRPSSMTPWHSVACGADPAGGVGGVPDTHRPCFGPLSGADGSVGDHPTTRWGHGGGVTILSEAGGAAEESQFCFGGPSMHLCINGVVLGHKAQLIRRLLCYSCVMVTNLI